MAFPVALTYEYHKVETNVSADMETADSGPLFWPCISAGGPNPDPNLSPTFKSVFEQDTDVVEKKQNKKNKGSRHASQVQRV